ncbi:hypothetical protein GUITHDRAFT_109410 [Guillardia theta CCMP2712]|uniref:Uncharacterized protein n=1 Tax=Guillardia theta (strain CCMP2712) TaxID=905079 RepID=L1J986_GUITC|nr:hypothetical protein GUITHDRAFT_109410 [Guillardia theta CCMP2712]EKX44635.1 hypothetical protein GUITHDRAFT_109410 [Guillardia theta CCMP2712]|eukprot:XP_005831615.1 hypothetical protein GUITHDRAFT_109410 [Guillardia theta CCMP2712]
MVESPPLQLRDQRWYRSSRPLLLLCSALLLATIGILGPPGPESLRSRSPVHETVVECRTDPDCIPSLKELVTRAAQRCAREASCVCNWNEDAKGCFMKEIDKHPDLLKEAKALEKLIVEREEIREQKQALRRKLQGEQAKIASLIDRGKRNIQLHDFKDAEKDARRAITVNKLVKKLNRAAGLHSWPSIRRQDVKINRFVGQLQDARRGLRRRRNNDNVRHEIKELSSSIHRISNEVRQVGSYVVDATARETKEKQARETKRDLRALVQKISGIVSSMRKRKESMEEASSLNATEKRFADAIAEGEKAVALNDHHHAEQFLHEAQQLHLRLMEQKNLPSSSPCRACDALAQTIQRS